MKIIFFGTSDFSAKILKSLASTNDIEICLVVTTPDKPVGRKQELKGSEVANLATELELPLSKPVRLGAKEVITQLTNLNTDLFVVAAYGKILPESILNIPKKGSINVHASLLPKYRGASPIHQAIIDGEKHTGITYMLMDSQLDHGKIIKQFAIPIENDELENELSDNLADLSASTISECLLDFFEGKIQAIEQDHSLATFTEIIKKEDGKIDWSLPSEKIYNKFRAYYIWPGIYTTFKGMRLKIAKCRIGEPQTGIEIGVVFENEGNIFVSCGDKESLQLIELQLEGKKQTSYKDFINGHKDFIGSKLG